MIKRGRMNKKGISPLIATVLIVGFVIALAGIFYVFFSKTVQEQMDKQGAEADGKAKCIGVDISFVDCSEGIIKFKNAGQQGVAGFTFRIKQTDESYKTQQIQESLEAGDEGEYEPSGAEGNSGDAIPIVPAKGYAYPCSDKAISFSC